MDDKDTFSLTRTYGVSVSLLWEAITQREHLKHWYFDFANDWKLHVGASFEWLAGPPDGELWKHRGEMLEIVENKRLSHSWEYPGYEGTSVVTWELTAVDANHTRLDFTHHFKVPFDPTVPELGKENFVAGWNEILNIGLVEYVEKLKS